MLLSSAVGASPEEPTATQARLRDELRTIDRSRVDAKKFRPLCDADGFPLVGNINNKGDRGMTVSEFCGQVRTAETKHGAKRSKA